MKITKLKKIIQEDKAVNSASESFTSFIVNQPCDKWNYLQEAVYLNKYLQALEIAGVIKILK